MRTDRRDIERLLGQHFPDMVGKSSDEWHGFLNEATGLTVPLWASNATAFDLWRQALAAKDYPVWPVTAARAEAVQQRGIELAALSAQSQIDQAERSAAEVERIAKEWRKPDAIEKS